MILMLCESPPSLIQQTLPARCLCARPWARSQEGRARDTVFALKDGLVGAPQTHRSPLMMGTVVAINAEALGPILRAYTLSLTCIFPVETLGGELACPVHRVLRGWGHLNRRRRVLLTSTLVRLCHGGCEHREAQEVP